MSNPEIMDKLYPKSIEMLEQLLGSKELEELKKYLHVYDGTAVSVKPVAKNITIFWVGRLANAAIIRTEGEDDIILSKIRDKAVPTLIFRKFKAVALRSYMKLMRTLWNMYAGEVEKNIIQNPGYKDVYGAESYDFMRCGISPGIEEKGRTVEGYMQRRCMKCPVDVLMGAVAGGDVQFNLASRLLGDPAFATTESYEQRTGNAVDEITYTTGMGGRKTAEEGAQTGALYTETLVQPGTLFVGKLVLYMPSPPELLYTLWLLANVNRYGARKEIWGTMEIYPVAIVGDYFEAGTAYSAAEKALGKTELEEVISGVKSYVESVTTSEAALVEFTEDTRSKILKELRVEDKDLYVEAWRNAANYVKGIKEYLRSRK